MLNADSLKNGRLLPVPMNRPISIVNVLLKMSFYSEGNTARMATSKPLAPKLRTTDPFAMNILIVFICIIY